MVTRFAHFVGGASILGATVQAYVFADSQVTPKAVPVVGHTPSRERKTALGRAKHCIAGAKDPLCGEWDADWDGRAHMKGSKTRYLYFVRHGQYFTKTKSPLGGSLTPLGVEQALRTGERLAQLGIAFNSVQSSNMPRALETTNCIAQKLGEIPLLPNNPNLREGMPCQPIPSVEREKVENERIEAAFNQLFYRAGPDQEADSHDIIVCHANVIRYFACRALQLPPEAWLRISLHHGSITVICIRPSGNVSLRSLGDAGHLAPSLLTTR